MEIVDSIMHMLAPQVVSSLADRLGATPAAVETGIGTSVAVLLSGMAHRIGEPGFMSQIFELVKSAPMHKVLPMLPEISSGAALSSPVIDAGSKLSSMLLGGQQGPIESFIGHQSGLSAGSGRELMSLAAPLTAGFLAQQIHEKHLTLSTFWSMIHTEGLKVHGMLPAALAKLVPVVSGPSALGIVASPAATSGGKKWLYALLALLLLALIAWLVSRGCNPAEAPDTTENPAATATAVATPAPGPLGEFIKRTLPDGTILNIPRLGIENKLLNFIEDPSRPIDKTTWFDFDRLTFDTGKATLQSSSTEQLQNIASILKAYPKVNVKLGGYTDNTGNKTSNLKLSGDRATNVQHALFERGINAARLEAQGYGEEHPVADNATPEGRQQNRRISLRVTAK